jgi:hypothetical protein
LSAAIYQHDLQTCLAVGIATTTTPTTSPTPGRALGGMAQDVPKRGGRIKKGTAICDALPNREQIKRIKQPVRSGDGAA